MYDLTIIIPIYNGEKYIERCLESIRKNKIHYEIIIINDGSTDRTKNILNDIKQKNITVINLENNHGVSYARNIGLKNTKGKYFTFVDIDDYVEDHIYDELFNILKTTDVDLLGYNFYEVFDKKLKSKYKYTETMLNKDEMIKELLKDKISMLIWDKIYKTEKYKNILFNENITFNEDNIYIIDCIMKTKKALFANKYLYNYCRNNTSLTRKYECKYIKQNNYINYLEKKYIKELKKYNEYEYYEAIYQLKYIHLYSQCIDKKNVCSYLRENINEKKLKKLLNYKVSKFIKLEIIIYLISRHLHLLLYPFYNKIRNILRRK